MSGAWRKEGRLVSDAAGRKGAMVPFVDGDHLYVSSRDAEGRSATVRATLAPGDQVALGTFDPEPVLLPGTLGAFDDSGAMGSCLVWAEGQAHLFYIGWSRGVTVPFHTAIGLAVGDGRTFERVSPAPVLGRNANDPYFTTSPWVILDAGMWRMWYTSCERWEPTARGPLHHYNIRYAESDDGVTWRTMGRRCIDFQHAGEYAIARPCVRKEAGVFRMWYSHRGASYRIGYAESVDGLAWTRLDHRAGIDASTDGWDSEMIEYPFVFEHGGFQRLLYNGNGYGMSGVGVATWEGA